MEQGLRTKLLTALTLAIVFATGGITGYAASARESDAAEALEAPAAAEAPRPTRWGYVFEQFERTDSQQVQIDLIMQRHRKAMSALNAELEHLQLRYQESSDSLSRATGEAISLTFPVEVRADYLQRLNERRERTRARLEAENESRGDSRR